MLDSIRGSKLDSVAGAARRQQPTDPLLKAIVRDLLIVTGGFLLMVVAVVLTAQGLSLN
ncbi:MAG TPA: hypothetical protein VEI03_05085 [Stellaceae bacterium]|nr:hypothetical protein [Stellaceae bacterium]